MTDRKAILLRAAFDLIRRSIGDVYVAETASIVTRYDDANCDGCRQIENLVSCNERSVNVQKYRRFVADMACRA